MVAQKLMKELQWIVISPECIYEVKWREINPILECINAKLFELFLLYKMHHI